MFRPCGSRKVTAVSKRTILLSGSPSCVSTWFLLRGDRKKYSKYRGLDPSKTNFN